MNNRKTNSKKTTVTALFIYLSIDFILITMEGTETTDAVRVERQMCRMYRRLDV